MTFLQIYERVCLKVWGNSQVPQGSAVLLQGQYGVIANVHRRIQEDRNFWFMEKAGTISVVSGTQNYALPTGFKEIVPKGLRIADADSGNFYEPLSPLHPDDAYSHFRDVNETSDYALYYEIYGGQLYLYPMPSLAVTLSIRYYGYLDRPVAATFTTETDILTQEGADAIVAYSAAEMLRYMNELNRAQMYEAEGNAALEILHQKDHKMRRAEINTCRYRGI